jgi:hypothetical protein
MKNYMASHPTTREVTLSEALSMGNSAGPTACKTTEQAAVVNGAPVAASAENRALTNP